MKKKVLFVIDSLDVAGAEKSLVTLLSLLDYSKYDVDLILFAHGKPLEELLPNEVNVIKPLKYTIYSRLAMKDALKLSVKHGNYKMLISRMKYTLLIRRKEYKNSQKARIYWQSVSQVIENNPINYDIAISYAQGVPTYYVAEKVKASKKFAWVNVTIRLDGEDQEFQKKYYVQYNGIIAVSDTTKETLIETFPEYEKKIGVIYDINNPELIRRMADIGVSYQDEFDGVRILTIGRLALQKGYDITLEACKKMKEYGINFKWYILGKGPLKEEIESYIYKHGLENHIILLGVTPNPYAYIKNADIYVQTSRFEGFGLAIAEARLLNIPVVTTRFDAVFNQMKHEVNGLVVDMDSQSVCDGIIQLISDNALRENIIRQLQNEKKGNVEELDKFYKLIG